MDHDTIIQKPTLQKSVTQADNGIIQNKMLLVLFFLLFVAVVIKSAWLSDDAFITLRTVRNFNEGYGLVWNTHERVQAYTHPLWMLLLSLTYFVTSETYYSTLFVSISLSAATAALIVLRISKNLTSGLFVLLLLTLSKAFIDYSTSGLENPLTYLLITFFFLVFMQNQAQYQPTTRTLFWLTFIAALGLINRMDTVLFFAPPLLYTFYKTRSWRSVAAVAIGSLPFLVWTLFAIIYYGFPFPNTAYAKLSNSADSMEIFMQGFLYLLDSLSVDPITLVIITLALIYSILTRSCRLILISCGIVLYIAYVIKIGGDFMSGRFLSAPYLMAVLVAQDMKLSLKEIGTYLLIAGTLFIGLLNSAQSPVFSKADYERPPIIHNNGILDERGHYYQSYGLMSADRLNFLVERGIVRGTGNPADFIHCGIGFRGFHASSYTRVIDYCGLADALIARLPTRYDPRWRIGHPVRQVPPGYLGTLRTGINQINDPDVALFYDRLTMLTQGEIFNVQRFIEIWRFNTGAYTHLLDPEKLSFPHIVELSLKDAPEKDTFEEDSGDNSIILAELFSTEDLEFEMNPQGVRLDLGKKYHPTHLDIGINGFYFDVVYFLDGAETGRQTVNRWPLVLGDRDYSVVTVPPSLANIGTDMIRISPRINLGRHRFTYINLLDLDVSDKIWDNGVVSSEELRVWLQFYYYTFYREDGLAREQMLAQILTRLQQIDEEPWAEVPQSILYDLLPIPAPTLHEVILPHLQTNILLTDANNHPKMRYLGSLEPEPITLDGQHALKFNLYFLVEETMDKRYALWFGVKKKRSGAENSEENEYDEQVIWEKYRKPPAHRWSSGMLVNLTPEIKLEPAEYEISFGFGIPLEGEKLFIEDTDISAVDLGKQTVK